MVSMDDIPPQIRWEIAAKSVTCMSIAYDALFRKAFGDGIDELDERIMAEGGKEVKKIAASLGLPAGNAKAVSDAWGILSTILFGPGFENEIAEATEDRVVERLVGCAMLNAHREMGVPPLGTPIHCQAFCKSAVEGLNPRYTQRFTRRMCTGDPFCESVIEVRR